MIHKNSGESNGKPEAGVIIWGFAVLFGLIRMLIGGLFLYS